MKSQKKVKMCIRDRYIESQGEKDKPGSKNKDLSK